MGRLINTTSMTVDGLVDVSDWFVAGGGHDAAARQLFVDGSGMLLGRKTYEGLAGFWPQQHGPWADLMNSQPKYVASHTLEGSLPWNAEAVTGDAVDTVAQLKDQVEGHLVMSGCGELARSLVCHGLVDEVQFWVHPSIGGGGTRPYLEERIPLDFIDATPFDSGVVLLRYTPRP